jgi:hypothetical protein
MSHTYRLRPLLVLAVTLVLAPAAAMAQGQDLVLPDRDHPLSGTWKIDHRPGTIVCAPPLPPMRFPGGPSQTVQILVYDGGNRLEMRAPNGEMTMRLVTADEWETDIDEDRANLRKVVREETRWFAWLNKGVYEGFLTPTSGVTIHYIMTFNPEEPRQVPGYLSSKVEQCFTRVEYTFTKQER